MLLRCPRCAVVESYGPPKVLGELVVCGRCHTPFGWQQGSAAAGETKPKHARPVLNPEVEKESTS